MFNLLENYMKRGSNYMERYARYKTRAILLELSDKQLQDAGISRHLLLQGPDQWPWQEKEGEVKKEVVKCSKKELRKAREQLHAMSDRSLKDIGLCRGQIDQAVMS